MPSSPSPRPSPTRRRRWPTTASPSPSWSGPWAGASQSDDKGPSAALAPSAARSTYSEYASRAALGRRLAAGPFSSLWPPTSRGPREEYRFAPARLTGVKRRLLWLLVVVVSSGIITGGYL